MDAPPRPTACTPSCTSTPAPSRSPPSAGRTVSSAAPWGPSWRYRATAAAWVRLARSHTYVREGSESARNRANRKRVTILIFPSCSHASDATHIRVCVCVCVTHTHTHTQVLLPICVSAVVFPSHSAGRRIWSKVAPSLAPADSFGGSTFGPVDVVVGEGWGGDDSDSELQQICSRGLRKSQRAMAPLWRRALLL